MYNSKATPIMRSLFIPFILLLALIINISVSARTPFDFVGPPPPPTSHYPQLRPSMTFLMRDAITSYQAPITNPNDTPQESLPFSKPIRTFPKIFGYNNPFPSQAYPNTYNSFSSQTLGFTFPSSNSATLQQELEYGPVTNIEEDVFEVDLMLGTEQLVGRAKGIYVAIGSAAERESHMIAMTVNFGDGSKVDSLRLFGVHMRYQLECHVAVIGGTGKFDDANGYAIIRSLLSSVDQEVNERRLLFNVYLS